VRLVKEMLHPRFRSAALAAIAAFLYAAAPSRAQSAAAAFPAAPAFREVVDETGRTVRIPQPVRRIVSLAPSLTETVYALGLQERLVGDTDFCDYPPDAQKKTKVGGAINPSLEQIVTLHPDLVLVTKGLNRLETVHALDELGISSYGTDPHTVNEIITSTKKLADVLGVPEAGAAVADDMQHRLTALQQRISGLQPKHVLFVVWTQPLISVGQGTFIADAMRHAGAVSIVDSAQDWPQVNLEEVARLQPEFLVFADSHSEAAPQELETLATLPAWRILEAVSKRRYAVISDAVNRPAPRIVSAIEELARQLHPEAFVEKESPTAHSPSVLHSALLPDAGPLDVPSTNGGCACAR
jgi:iron complex transport system substrate-binding protein